MQWKFFLKKSSQPRIHNGQSRWKKRRVKNCARRVVFFKPIFSTWNEWIIHWEFFLIILDPSFMFEVHDLLEVDGSKTAGHFVSSQKMRIFHASSTWFKEFSPLLITRVISTSRCSSVLSSRLLESVPDPNLSSWIFNWCYANNTPNLYTELFKAPYKPTVPENETWKYGLEQIEKSYKRSNSYQILIS